MNKLFFVFLLSLGSLADFYAAELPEYKPMQLFGTTYLVQHGEEELAAKIQTALEHHYNKINDTLNKALDKKVGGLAFTLMRRGVASHIVLHKLIPTAAMFYIKKRPEFSSFAETVQSKAANEEQLSKYLESVKNDDLKPTPLGLDYDTK